LKERTFFEKFRERLEVAKLCVKNGYLNASVSNCYYALFNLMQAFLGKPENKRWKHGGIVKAFLLFCRERKIFLSVEIDKIAYELYQLRRIADYEQVSISDAEKVKELIRSVEKVAFEVENAEKKI